MKTEKSIFRDRLQKITKLTDCIEVMLRIICLKSEFSFQFLQNFHLLFKIRIYVISQTFPFLFLDIYSIILMEKFGRYFLVMKHQLLQYYLDFYFHSLPVDLHTIILVVKPHNRW